MFNFFRNNFKTTDSNRYHEKNNDLLFKVPEFEIFKYAICKIYEVVDCHLIFMANAKINLIDCKYGQIADRSIKAANDACEVKLLFKGKSGYSNLIYFGNLQFSIMKPLILIYKNPNISEQI